MPPRFKIEDADCCDCQRCHLLLPCYEPYCCLYLLYSLDFLIYYADLHAFLLIYTLRRLSLPFIDALLLRLILRRYGLAMILMLNAYAMMLILLPPLLPAYSHCRHDIYAHADAAIRRVTPA